MNQALFPSWENEYKEMQQRSKNEAEHKMIAEFSKTYPTLSFNDLKKQKPGCFTNDGCSHYQHMNNKQIYSWLFRENKWLQVGIEHQKKLTHLFNY